MATPERTQPTLAEIAKACAVSTSTVSRALKDSPKLPEATRRRIQAVAADLGYAPNYSLSRVMSEIRSRKKQAYRETLGYITADPIRYESRIYQGVCRRAEELGYNIDRFVLGNPAKEVSALGRMLGARGVRGLVVAPFGQAYSTLQLNWSRHAAVAIGDSLAEPDLHRVARDVVHMLRLVFARLEKRGYRRIGFLIDRSQEERMDYNTLAGVLVHDWHQSQDFRVAPLIAEKLTAERIVDWYRRERPDLIFTMDHLVCDWLEAAGHFVPGDVGVFLFNCYTPDSSISGIYPAYESMGMAAVEQVSGLLDRGEFGYPEGSRRLLVPGQWCEGRTIRPLAGKKT
ncbi:LacI family DNA-binding transcriptional regulator [Coraliomargarita parva]|uniref:LacI family DNA-binding transcriptional regulator n=1 Tax=Coraliomargarita parva TaxID=3014050 RepID=UPI0022B3B7E9|nr:LacI family DNA-binding transcriptional regulator [Coraliomargarita parva]